MARGDPLCPRGVRRPRIPGPRGVFAPAGPIRAAANPRRRCARDPGTAGLPAAGDLGYPGRSPWAVAAGDLEPGQSSWAPGSGPRHGEGRSPLPGGRPAAADSWTPRRLHARGPYSRGGEPSPPLRQRSGDRGFARGRRLGLPGQIPVGRRGRRPGTRSVLVGPGIRAAGFGLGEAGISSRAVEHCGNGRTTRFLLFELSTVSIAGFGVGGSGGKGSRSPNSETA